MSSGIERFVQRQRILATHTLTSEGIDFANILRYYPDMKIAFHTLGCKVNQYETEAMAEIFRNRGHEIVGEGDFADVYVVNTCTVTAMADRKSRQFIRRMKKRNPESIIAVTGCYVQIAPDSVAEIDGVDLITGINEKGSLPERVEDLAKKYLEEGRDDRAKDKERSVERHVREHKDLSEYEDLGSIVSAENRTRAYIKIQDGCNRFCSYCVIPYARGNVRSRPLEQIIQEAKDLVDAGYKEIVLTGINTALYGADPGGDPEKKASGSVDIETVIAALNDIDGDFRVRLSSLEPTVVDAEFVSRLLKYEKLCHHMHLSAQSGSDKVLKEMNRSYTVSQYMDIVKVLRDFDPHYGISTDIITGFPGETEDDLRASLELVKKCGFCKTHIFRYSPRPGTEAAKRVDQIAPEVKADRSERLQAAADEAADEFFGLCKGNRRRVLIEEYIPDKKLLCGYTDNYIRVYLNRADEGREMINEFIDIELEGLLTDGVLGTL